MGYKSKLEILNGSKANSLSLTKKDCLKVDKPKEQIDGGYAWVVLYSCIILQMFGASLLGTYGVLLVNIVDSTGYKTSFISWYGALTCLTQGFSSFFLGPLVEIYSCRTVTIIGSLICTFSYISTAFVKDIPYILFTLGFVQGLGISCFHVCPNIIVSRWFSKKQSMALTLITFGKGIGQLMWGPYAAYTVDLYGWRGSLIMIGGVVLHGCILGVLIKDPVSVKTVEKKGGLFKVLLKNMIPIELIKNKWFILCVLGNFPLLIGHGSVLSMLPRRIVDIGYSNIKASTTISIIGGTTSIVRLIVCGLSGVSCCNKSMACAVATLITGVSAIMTIFLKDYTSFAVFSAVFGSVSAVYISLITPIIIQLVELDYVSQAVAWLNVVVGLSMGTCRSSVGILYDLQNDATICFVMGGVFLIITSLLFLFMYFAGVERKSPKLIITKSHEEKQSISDKYEVTHL
ncbi:DgyrCDS8570 [Dimorphilus gyrociliatus]|uniref:DgyrCDS8570 n=1 Tax=Dimorphilus gyrociliatus TaxID=2664684 RepID=A0A7I8VWR0_9ANNE|nr:DgyrCDS8570 [Dimorphilus gyrociliatus]